MKILRRFVFIIIPGLLFYVPIFQYYFSQDDFIHLYSSKAESLGEFLNFFNPFFQFPDIFFYRPLATQVYFFVNHSLFELTPLPFRLETLLFHLTNSILFYLIINRIWKNQKLALFSAAFYNISAIHFLSLFYISAFQQILRTFFIFICFLAVLKFKESGRKFFYLGSILAFIASLLSKETSIILPGLLLIIYLYDQKFNLDNIKRAFFYLIPFFLTAGAYLMLRVAGFQSIFGAGSYESVKSISEVIQNLRWYLLWSFGLPEILSSYPSIKPQAILQFIKDFQTGWIIIISFVFLVAATLIGWIRTKLPEKRLILLSIVLFFLSLGPVLLLAQHRYPQYLDVAYLGFLPLLLWPAVRSFSSLKILSIFLILSFIALQYFTLKLTESTHWTTNRSKIALNYLNKTSNIASSTSNAGTIIFTGDTQKLKELSHALTGKYALLVWYPKKVKDVIYTDVTSNALPIPNIITYQISDF